MNYKRIEKDGYVLYQNKNGVEIGTAKDTVIEQDGYAFRNRTVLDNDKY